MRTVTLLGATRRVVFTSSTMASEAQTRPSCSSGDCSGQSEVRSRSSRRMAVSVTEAWAIRSTAMTVARAVGLADGATRTS